MVSAPKDAESGDTLIEVLLAMVILSVIIVGAMTMMNTGVAANRNATEHTIVRQQLNAQSEQLNYLRDQFSDKTNPVAVNQWTTIINSYLKNTGATDANDGSCSVGSKAFYLNNTTAGIKPGVPVVTAYNETNKPETYAVAGRGMWIEAFRPSSGGVPYIDFVIRACWEPSGGGSVLQREATVVRLYEPR